MGGIEVDGAAPRRLLGATRIRPRCPGTTAGFALGDLESYSMNPDGSDPINLTNTHGTEGVPIDDVLPAWSPGGRWIAFTRGVEPCDQLFPTLGVSL